MTVAEETILGIQEVFMQGEYHLLLKETNDKIMANPSSIDQYRTEHKQAMKDKTMEFCSIMEDCEVATPVDESWVDSKVDYSYNLQVSLGFLDGIDIDANTDVKKYQMLALEYKRFFDEYYPLYASSDLKHPKLYADYVTEEMLNA